MEATSRYGRKRKPSERTVTSPQEAPKARGREAQKRQQRSHTLARQETPQANIPSLMDQTLLPPQVSLKLAPHNLKPRSLKT